MLESLQEIDTAATGCLSDSSNHHETSSLLLASTILTKSQNSKECATQRRNQDRYATPTMATQGASERDKTASDERHCSAKSKIELPSIVLEKIKEGMAQLLAEYTWPWYEQNVHLFRSLYNVHLVNDVALAREDNNCK